VGSNPTSTATDLGRCVTLPAALCLPGKLLSQFVATKRPLCQVTATFRLHDGPLAPILPTEACGIRIAASDRLRRATRSGLRPWLDASTGSIRQPVMRIGTPLIPAALPGDDGGIADVAIGRPVPVVISGQLWATQERVSAGFAAASSRLDVPLAHTILRRSLAELHAGVYRLCVIDACSVRCPGSPRRLERT
jgi:hypothetical protein